MAKIIRFPEKKPVYSEDPAMNAQLEENLGSLSPQVLERLQALVQNIVADLPGDDLHDLTFLPQPGTLTRLQRSRREGKPALLTYTATQPDLEEERRYRYTLYLQADFSRGDVALTPTGVFGREGDRISSLDLETGRWETDPLLNRLARIYEEESGQGLLLQAFCEFMDLPFALLDGEVVLAYLENCRPLTDLCDRLEELADFFFLALDESHIMILLVPLDERRCGAAVGVQGEEYVLYQMLTTADLEQAMEQSGKTGRYDYGAAGFQLLFAGPEGEDRDVYLLFREAGRTGDPEEMAQSLALLWDHFSGRHTAFAVPLSLTRYACSKKPFLQMDIRGAQGAEEVGSLTGGEIWNYQLVLRAFDPGRLTPPAGEDRPKRP